MSSIRIFVGVAANHEDCESQSVLEYTLMKHSSQPLDITWMMQSRDVDSWFYVGKDGWQTTGWATPFSAFRWAVPYLAEADGYDRAIYMDSDFIVFGDVADLWNTPFEEGKVVIANGGGRYCCSMWDTASALRRLPAMFLDLRSDPNAHPRWTHYYNQHSDLVQRFAPDNQWNWLDYQSVPFSQLKQRGIKAIHYTRVDMQLQMKHAQARLAKEGRKHWYTGRTKNNDFPGLQQLFDVFLTEAVVDGFPLERYMDTPRFGTYIGR